MTQTTTDRVAEMMHRHGIDEKMAGAYIRIEDALGNVEGVEIGGSCHTSGNPDCIGLSIPHIDYAGASGCEGCHCESRFCSCDQNGDCAQDCHEYSIEYSERKCEEIEAALTAAGMVATVCDGLTDETAHVVCFDITAPPSGEVVEAATLTIHYRDDQVGDMLEEFGSLADAERDSTANWLLSMEEQGPVWYELHGCGYPDSDCTAAQSEIQYLTRCSDETHDSDCDNAECIRDGVTCLYVGVRLHADVPTCDCWERDDAPDACYDGVCSHPDPSERAHIWGEYSGVRGGHGLDTSWSETCKVCGIVRETADKQVPHQAEQTVRFPYVSYHRGDAEIS